MSKVSQDPIEKMVSELEAKAATYERAIKKMRDKAVKLKASKPDKEVIIDDSEDIIHSNWENMNEELKRKPKVEKKTKRTRGKDKKKRKRRSSKKTKKVKRSKIDEVHNIKVVPKRITTKKIVKKLKENGVDFIDYKELKRLRSKYVPRAIKEIMPTIFFRKPTGFTYVAIERISRWYLDRLEFEKKKRTDGFMDVDVIMKLRRWRAK